MRGLPRPWAWSTLPPSRARYKIGRPRKRTPNALSNFLLPRTPARRFMRVAATLAGVAIIPLGCGGEADTAERRLNLELERQQALQQFAATQNRVRQTQAEALADPSLAPLQERFYELLRERMIEIEPRSEAWLDSAQQLGPAIDELSRPQILQPGEVPAPLEEREQVVREFSELEKTLQPVQNRAMADPEVAAAFEALQDSMHAVMLRINPDAAPTLREMRRASARVDSIDAKLRALED